MNTEKYFKDISRNGITNKIDLLLEKYKVQPVGKGYVDLIVNPSLVVEFIEDLSKLGVLIKEIGWWCHVTEESKSSLGCPHGLVGPRCRYEEGWFSETLLFENFSERFEEDLYNLESIKEINETIIDYIKVGAPRNPEYSKCFYPGLWLLMPD
jgi:hypothetical protein